jgi:DNA-binding CsgD family transcriptional regulator
MQIAFQMQGGDLAGAGATARDAIPRLPLAIPGAGVVTSFLRILSDTIPVEDAVIEAYTAAGPPHTVEYDVYGADTGKQTVAAARLDRSVPEDVASHLSLTPREHEITNLASRGLSAHAIGQELGISNRTVEVHLTKIFRKTGVRTRFELLALLRAH